MQISHPGLVRMDPHRGDALGFFKRLLDPFIAAATLVAACQWAQQPIGPAEGILAVLAFSLVWPGQIPFHRVQRGLMRDLALRWAITAALVSLAGLLTGATASLQPKVLPLWFLVTPLLQYGAHQALPRLLAALPIHATPVSAVIVGAGALGQELMRAIVRDPFESIRVAAFFDDRNPQRLQRPSTGLAHSPMSQALPSPASTPAHLRLLGRLGDVAAYVQAQRIQRIYIALPMASQPRILALLDSLRDTTASIYFAPDIFVHDLIQARVETVGGMPLVAICESPFHGPAAFIKRLSDLCLASVAIVLTAPIMASIAVAVACSSPGPILFRQRRYGLDGEEIEVWKFRSMRTQDNGAVVRQASRTDDRVTPIGRWIRKTSIDELPQFFNVLQGRMSVVGPRPHAVAHNELFRSLIKGYMVRHKVKPGITGWAQVNGARGETATTEAMKRRIDLDLTYLRNWSLMLDLRIIMRTVRLVLHDPNAY